MYNNDCTCWKDECEVKVGRRFLGHRLSLREQILELDLKCVFPLQVPSEGREG